MAMTPDDEQRLSGLQNEANRHLSAYHDAIQRRDLFMREVYGAHRADPVDLMRVTGMTSRGQMHSILKGARRPTWRRQTVNQLGDVERAVLDYMATRGTDLVAPVEVQQALEMHQTPARAMATLAQKGHLDRPSALPEYRFVRGES